MAAETTMPRSAAVSTFGYTDRSVIRTGLGAHGGQLLTACTSGSMLTIAAIAYTAK